MSTNKVIDSHLHVWANQNEAITSFPYVQEPPKELINSASTDKLIEQMNSVGVDGALIVQPINHKYDHSYVIQAIKQYPDKFKGMLLHDPTLSKDEAVTRVEDLALNGFVGVRYNPYLWDKIGDQEWKSMSNCDAGMAVYKRCGELGMPVGIMCFQGLSLHYNDIVQFVTESPNTILILDHFAFTAIDDDKAFDQLIQLAQYKSVYVKISALFRLKDTSPYKIVYEKRFIPLLNAYGSDRLMYGSDFPYVLQQSEGYKMKDLVSSWCPDDTTRSDILGGTAERVFGPWGVKTS